ncbi:hypothetical protein Tco_0294775 [Tanacetum coccineum]
MIQEPEQGTTTTTAKVPTLRKGIVITELGTSTTTIIISSQPSHAKLQDKGKGIMVEPEKPLKKKDQISFDEQEAKRLQAEFDEEERLAREKDEANVALTEEWDDIQAKQRRKHFAAKRAEEKRNRPPTKAQQRKIICTYLKNMGGKKPKDLKNKSFDSIQKTFDKAFKRVNTFVDYRTELVEESSKKAEIELEESSKKAEAEIAQESSIKRAREELEQKSSKKQKVEKDKESKELKQCLEIVPDNGDDLTIDATPLSIKAPTIVDYKIYQEGKKIFF